MRFSISCEKVFIRGNPVVNGEPSRLWLNGKEVLPSIIEHNFKHYYSGFTWGYNGYGTLTTALALGFALFNDKYLARALSGLIETKYVHHWPFNQAFQCEINLMDFWITNKNVIIEAEQKADWAQRIDQDRIDFLSVTTD